MRRRDFITLLGGAAAAWPLTARAQQPARMRRIGVLMLEPASDSEGQSRIALFRQALDKLGWADGRNVQIDYRWNAFGATAREAVADLLSLAPDVIVAEGSPALAVVQQATNSVPILFVLVSEPVEQGFVQSLSRPGGNITGFSNLEPTLGGKWLELLREIAPNVTRVMFIFHPANSGVVLLLKSAQAVAPRFAMEVTAVSVRDAAEIEMAVTALARESRGGLVLPPDGLTNTHRKLIVELAACYRLPAIYARPFFVNDGGLLSYGNDSLDQFRQVATYVDRILKGERPADLPVQQPTKFELTINMQTAKALGLTVPLTLQVAADKVIE